ncbi:MAG: DUF58 domain-containing protein [Ignavibacteriaceae bacterium]
MKVIKAFYLNSNFFIYIWGIVFLFVLGYFFKEIFFLAQLAFYVFLILTIVDAVILFREKKGMFALRETPIRLSNGDDNEIKIYVENFFNFKVNVKIIDEIPFQFQVRNFQFTSSLLPGENKIISYKLKPVKRGEYNFGNINLFISSPLRLVLRKFQFSGDKIIPVYPSYIQMRKYELFAISNRLSDVGIKRIRKIGHSTEFEQIKEYVTGDDYRTINWKATARKNLLMVNNYQDEKSQQVFNVIDMGRTMKMPFNGMSLLDYAINTSLVISNIALHKDDKAGVVTFSNKIGNILPAENRSIQMHKILELLYKQTTDFLESDFESLCSILLSKITHRSLILLYTNFETIDALKRQLHFIRRLIASHLVVVIFFENTELKSLLEKEPESTEEIYVKTIGEKFAFEKRQVVKELNRYKIHSILTPPEKLSVNTINKYLELKARSLI